jgi:hypothetical protein
MRRRDEEKIMINKNQINNKALEATKIMNENKTILHLCADTGSDSKPYRDAGYNVILVGEQIGIENFEPPPNAKIGFQANFRICRITRTANKYGISFVMLSKVCKSIF